MEERVAELEARVQKLEAQLHEKKPSEQDPDWMQKYQRQYERPVVRELEPMSLLSEKVLVNLVRKHTDISNLDTARSRAKSIRNYPEFERSRAEGGDVMWEFVPPLPESE